MTRPTSQQIHALVAQPAGTVAGGVNASAPSVRTVALSLLIDRALSA
ncbi:hypothetical protein PQR02_11470 [Paraburkholderia sediminicola]|uniref:Uncharacterized protein n=1 Tax=Paraburkholderia rhynchosiae TaxID=487049 RepID=A0ACC7NF10_9BURK